METPFEPARLASEVPGAADLIEWFGYWPSFHDAEVTRIELARFGTSRISVHTFECTGEVGPTGRYLFHKHVVVSFLLDGITDLELAGFNCQNVVAGVLLRKVDHSYELVLSGCYGVEGVLRADSMRIELAPGPPPDSQYRTGGAQQLTSGEA